MSLKQLALRGIFWNSLGQYSSQFIRIVLTVILARLVTPAQFGLVAMITVFSGFSIVLIDFGFRNAIIQNKDVKEIDLHSIFWTNILIGFVLSCILYLAAPAFATFYNEPQLIPLTRIIAFTYFFSSLQIVPSALLAKKLDFKKLALPNLLAVALGGCIAIVLAIAGLGAKAIAVQLLATSVLAAVFIHMVSDWQPKFAFRKSAITKYLNLSSSLFANSSFSYAASNGDDLLVGKLFGQNQLGLYNKAYAIIDLPVSSISKILSSVFLPSFAKIQDDKVRIGTYYLQLTKLVTIFSFPLMLSILLFSKEFVLLIFGEDWLAAIPFVKIFCLSGMIASINSLLGSVIVSQGRTDLIWKEVFLKRPSVLIGVFIGSFFSVLAIAIGKLIADLFNLGVTFYQIRSAIHIPIRHQIATLGNTAIASLVLIGVIVAIQFFLPDQHLYSIIALIIAILAYGVVIRKLESQLIHQVWTSLTDKINL